MNNEIRVNHTSMLLVVFTTNMVKRTTLLVFKENFKGINWLKSSIFRIFMLKKYHKTVVIDKADFRWSKNHLDKFHNVHSNEKSFKNTVKPLFWNTKWSAANLFQNRGDL